MVNANSKPTKKPYLGTFYDWTSRCDQCGQHRSHGSHARCSKRRQAMKQKAQVVPHGR